ncbi:hypothetical protein GCM10010399_31850 [Dactylosporangium fulvum]|uniref:Uncharacterized protein n=1 Tax=Dactylosporangium fulvum TaxID=53359 RepID=A0ABY5W3I8_9ACTN|nr:hypothetical protein [Dactylosporangium fulvum]UWP83886.1 hypothetical protein Dfulv_06410 [Dactylosporangium fulvum]
MSDIETYEGGNEVEYADYSAGQEHGQLDQLHQASGSEYSRNEDFNVYEQDHAAAENTSFQQGHSVQWTDGNGASYSETDYTNYNHSAAETDHIFAASGSQSVEASEWSEFDALRERFDTAFVDATEFRGGAGELTAK